MNDKLNSQQSAITKLTSTINVEDQSLLKQSFKNQLTNDIFKIILDQTQLSKYINQLESRLNNITELDLKLTQQYSNLKQAEARDEYINSQLSQFHTKFEKISNDTSLYSQNLERQQEFNRELSNKCAQLEINYENQQEKIFQQQNSVLDCVSSKQFNQTQYQNMKNYISQSEFEIFKKQIEEELAKKQDANYLDSDVFMKSLQSDLLIALQSQLDEILEKKVNIYINRIMAQLKESQKLDLKITKLHELMITSMQNLKSEAEQAQAGVNEQIKGALLKVAGLNQGLLTCKDALVQHSDQIQKQMQQLKGGLESSLAQQLQQINLRVSLEMFNGVVSKHEEVLFKQLPQLQERQSQWEEHTNSRLSALDAAISQNSQQQQKSAKKHEQVMSDFQKKLEDLPDGEDLEKITSLQKQLTKNMESYKADQLQMKKQVDQSIYDSANYLKEYKSKHEALVADVKQCQTTLGTLLPTKQYLEFKLQQEINHGALLKQIDALNAKVDDKLLNFSEKLGALDECLLIKSSKADLEELRCYTDDNFLNLTRVKEFTDRVDTCEASTRQIQSKIEELFLKVYNQIMVVLNFEIDEEARSTPVAAADIRELFQSSTIEPPHWIRRFKGLVQEIKGYQSQLQRKVDYQLMVKINEMKANKSHVKKLQLDLSDMQRQLIYSVFQFSIFIKSNFEQSEQNKLLYLKVLQKQTNQLLSWIAVRREVDADVLGNHYTIKKINQIINNIFLKFKMHFYQKDKFTNTNAVTILDEYIKDISYAQPDYGEGATGAATNPGAEGLQAQASKPGQTEPFDQIKETDAASNTGNAVLAPN